MCCGPRRYPGGLAQQGWADGLTRAATGTAAGSSPSTARCPPLADADSQAVAEGQLRALAELDPAARAPVDVAGSVAGLAECRLGPR